MVREYGVHNVRSINNDWYEMVLVTPLPYNKKPSVAQEKRPWDTCDMVTFPNQTKVYTKSILSHMLHVWNIYQHLP
jgi:hypothetical protein